MSLQGFSGLMVHWWVLGHISHHLECSPGGPNAIDYITSTGPCHGLQEQKTTSIYQEYHGKFNISMSNNYFILKVPYQKPRISQNIANDSLFLPSQNLLLGRNILVENVKHS
jgi:hypothetical protein